MNLDPTLRNPKFANVCCVRHECAPTDLDVAQNGATPPSLPLGHSSQGLHELPARTRLGRPMDI